MSGILSQITDAADTEKRARVRKGEHDFAFFCAYYLRDYFFAAFAGYQRVVLDIINQGALTQAHITQLQVYMNRNHHKALVPTMGMRAIINVEPRGHGKTTRMCFAYPLWRLLYMKSRFVVLFGASASAVQGTIESIKQELESNERLLDDFGDVRGEPWNNTFLALSNETAIKGFGAGASVRGTKYRHHRPDLAIIDDLLSDEDARSRAVRSKRYEWFLRAVIPLGRDLTIVMTNTILHDDDVVSRLLERVETGELHHWIALRFSSIIPKDGSVDDGMPLWPEYWSREQLLAKRDEIGSRVFYVEYMNMPLAPDEALFHPHWIQSMPHDVDTKHMKVYVAIDPSAGVHDRSAMVAIGIGSDHRRYVLDCWAQRCSPDID